MNAMMIVVELGKNDDVLNKIEELSTIFIGDINEHGYGVTNIFVNSRPVFDLCGFKEDALNLLRKGKHHESHKNSNDK